MRRRDFIRISGYGMAGFALGSGVVLGKEKPELFLVEGEMIGALRKAVSLLGGMKRFCKKGDKVVIKPNISFASGPEKGANTNVWLVAEVAKMCIEEGAKEVLIVDNPLKTPSVVMERSGIKKALEGIDRAKMVFFTEDEFFEEVSISGARTLERTQLMKPVLNCDLLINMPKAKTHNTTTVTLSLKNLMGLVKNRKVFHYGHNLSEAIADLASFVRPALTIMDATTVMVDGGPGGPGRLEPLRTIIVGTNQLEVDVLTVSLTSWYGKSIKAEEVPHLLMASKLGLGRIELDKIPFERLKL